ncbi:type I-A CRISPR-associated protein Cas5 [Candidatus Bathyarchaeota archaeon]|nr:type I-A CRISPR-associated protein Cas5 [Candidatus Bathyarchaeota archaeon]MBS7618156.1 type I-A CRISPR-associated protein Cas5 [Candidatus Bathyarchaeota archaeon]
MLTTIEVAVRESVFSVQRPLSYQVGDSLILPQPSTLVNTLVFCLSRAQSITAQDFGDKYLRNLIESAGKGLVRVTIKPLTPLISTPILLSRLRTLEWTVDKIEDKISGNEKLTNAMIREYVFGAYSIYFLFTDDEIAEKSTKSLSLINRVGDTESLISITRVERTTLIGREKSGLIDTYTPSSWLERASGNFVISKFCKENYAKYRLEKVGGKPADVARKRLELFLKFSEDFYLPLTVEKTTKNYLIYKPVAFLAKTKDDFTIAHFKTTKDDAKIVVKEEWLT